MRPSTTTTILANLSLLSGAALAQLTTTTTTGECTSGCTHPIPTMPAMNGTAVPYPAGNGTTVHISNCPSAYSTGGMMPTSAPPASGVDTTPVPCDGASCPDTSTGMMPTDSGMGMPSSDAGPSMGMEGGYSNAGVSFRGDFWVLGGVVGVLVGLLSWV